MWLLRKLYDSFGPFEGRSGHRLQPCCDAVATSLLDPFEMVERRKVISPSILKGRGQGVRIQGLISDSVANYLLS